LLDRVAGLDGVRDRRGVLGVVELAADHAEVVPAPAILDNAEPARAKVAAQDLGQPGAFGTLEVLAAACLVACLSLGFGYAGDERLVAMGRRNARRLMGCSRAIRDTNPASALLAKEQRQSSR
jgi:hypothetical protein